MGQGLARDSMHGPPWPAKAMVACNFSCEATAVVHAMISNIRSRRHFQRPRRRDERGLGPKGKQSASLMLLLRCHAAQLMQTFEALAV
jgi:hypothetical protein